MHFSVRTMVTTALLGALIVVLGLTPLGFIPVPTPAGSATTVHIPVILAAIVAGPAGGAAAGFLFGAFSFWQALTSAANPLARIMFSDPLVAFLPRILIGLVAYGAYRAARHRSMRTVIAVLIAAVCGDTTYRLLSTIPSSVDNPYPSFSLLGLLAALVVAAVVGWLLWRWLPSSSAAPTLAALAGSLTNTVGVLGLVTLRGYLPWQVALGIGLIQGLPEAVVAAILTVAVVTALSRAHLLPSTVGIQAAASGAAAQLHPSEQARHLRT